MNFTNKKTALIKSISELKDADYSKVPELNGIYRRLSKGRKQFADIFDKNIKAVMQISSLDLTMKHQIDKVTVKVDHISTISGLIVDGNTLNILN